MYKFKICENLDHLKISRYTVAESNLQYYVHIASTISYPGKNFGVADDNDAELGPGESHIESACVVEETDALMLVGADAGEDDEVFHPALESIHTGHF